MCTSKYFIGFEILGYYVFNCLFVFIFNIDRKPIYLCWSCVLWASLVVQRLKCLPGIWEIPVQSLSWEDHLEKEMATHSSTLAWRIPWREEPGGLQSTGSQRVRHDWAISLSLCPITLLQPCFLVPGNFCWFFWIFHIHNYVFIIGDSFISYFANCTFFFLFHAYDTE